MSQVAQPHEVTLLVGAGILLTFTAGVLNISTFLGPEKKLISHMSGTTVKMGAFFGEGDAKNGCENLAIMACFFAGALLAGFLTSKPEWKSLYTCALAMAAVGVLQVVVAALTDNEQAVAGFYIGAFACGLQNAMLTTITGFMRTTHVTGTVTDIGLLVGQGYPSKKGDHAHWWKTKVLAIDLVSYALGGVAGRGLFDVGLKYKVGYVPGGITLAVSAAALYDVPGGVPRDRGDYELGIQIFPVASRGVERVHALRRGGSLALGVHVVEEPCVGVVLCERLLEERQCCTQHGYELRVFDSCGGRACKRRCVRLYS